MALANELVKLTNQAMNVDQELDSVFEEMMGRWGTPEWKDTKRVWADYFDSVCTSIGGKRLIDLGGEPAENEESK